MNRRVRLTDDAPGYEPIAPDQPYAPASLWVLVCGCDEFERAAFAVEMTVSQPCNICHQRPRLVRYERSEP